MIAKLLYLGKIQVSLTNTVKWLKEGNYVTVGVSGGPGSGLYVGRGVIDDNLGVAVPVIKASAKDPCWAGSHPEAVFTSTSA
jgi:hypothetical protein